MQRYEATGSIEPRPTGGSVSPQDEQEEFILGLIKEKPDMILDEIVEAMTKAKIPGSRTAVWRFLDRHGITVKKKASSVKSVGHLGFRKLAEGMVQGYLSDAESAVPIGFSHRDLGFVVQALYDAA